MTDHSNHGIKWSLLGIIITETTISKAFGDLTAPRVQRRIRHPLVNILTISICAIICSCDDFYSIEEYGQSKIKWFDSFLDLNMVYQAMIPWLMC
ncbi:MAG: transposase family protein [Colwellia sp.]|nr:transposase family protein [Colwellia sp.]NQZ80651.1 transposase family protein [Colwellia sp.]